MKKILIILIIVIIGSLFFYNYFVALLFLLASFLQMFFFNLYRKPIPNIFREDKRDYSIIKIGSENVKCNSDVLDCTSYDRSLDMDFQILKRMYSFLDANGEVEIFFDCTYDNIYGINISDLYYLHRVTMDEYDIQYCNLKYYFPFWSSPLYSIQYLFWILFPNIHLRRKRSLDKSSLKQYIRLIEEFVNERKIKTTIILNGIYEEDYKELSIVSKYMNCRRKQ